jgi:hypothetical protein
METIQVQALATSEANGKLEPFEIFLGLAGNGPSRHQSSALRDLAFGPLNAQQ